MRINCVIACIILALSSATIISAQKTAKPESVPKPVKKPGYFSRARFETHYDKFQDKTTVSFKPLPLTGGARLAFKGEMLSLMGAFQFKGKSLAQPVSAAELGFLSTSQDWLFLRDQHLIALVDGERVNLGVAMRDSDISLWQVKEVLVFDVSYETLSKIANGSSVEMQLGSREFKLKDNHLYTLRELASRMTVTPVP
jgi:hypothetical protein